MLATFLQVLFVTTLALFIFGTQKQNKGYSQPGYAYPGSSYILPLYTSNKHAVNITTVGILRYIEMVSKESISILIDVKQKTIQTTITIAVDLWG